jgi:hypothetical protein
MQQPGVLQAITGGSVLGQCIILDISEGGARLEVTRPVDLPDVFVLTLSRNAEVSRQCQVRWRSKTEIGVQFQR